MKNSKRNSPNGLIDSEGKYLRELINDFPPKKPIGLDEAITRLKINYEQLVVHIDNFANLIKESGNSNESNFNFKFLCLLFHKYLFTNILSNAGEPRNNRDINGGIVGFGGENKRIPGNLQYPGYSPDKIEEALNQTFHLLDLDAKTPIENGMEFYRSFVSVHPFYDANGRIARLLLSIYLKCFDYHINWEGIEKNKSEFIKRLNECHKREGQEIYRKYFNWLTLFFKQFITKIVETDELP